MKSRQQNQFFHASRWTCVVALAFLICGCSSFNRQWKQAGQQPAPSAAITGRWEGRWLSDVNAHSGKLRCLITHQTNDLYAARFRATYLKILRFSYTVPLTVNATNEVWHFRGAEDLGAMAGGVYRYVGSATATNFHSTYDSKYDRGTFEMQRP